MQATDSLLGPALRRAAYPADTRGTVGTEFTIDPSTFQEVFCADLPARQAAMLAETQQPAADLAFCEPTHNPAWKSLPSWAVVSTADNAIGVSGLRQMATRAGSITIETDASHVVMVSQPTNVSNLICSVLRSLTRPSDPSPRFAGIRTFRIGSWRGAMRDVSITVSGRFASRGETANANLEHHSTCFAPCCARRFRRHQSRTGPRRP